MQMSVNAVHPAGVGVITRRHRAGWAVAFALVGLLAGASVALATVLPTATDGDIAGPPTTVAPAVTTIPSEPGPPIIIPPVDGEEGEGEGQNVDGTAELILADDPAGGFGDLSALGGSWDDFGFGIDCEFGFTTTTTEPEETTTTTKPPYTNITAHQYYGPASSTPYEKIYGTAPPGTKVKLTSAYGSSEATVGCNGEYYLKIYFSGQPSWEYFPITATVGSKVFTFQFKWTGSYTATANQYYGPEHDQRYDKVFGTAPPGTVVTTSSDYGSSEMTVVDGGSYYLKIYFNETLPAGQQIQWTATLKDPGGTVLLTKTFDFTYTPDYTVTASQYWGPEHDQREDKVRGTAPPGTVVTTSSDYGSSGMEVDSSGSYYLYIYFDETLPAGQQIQWTATLKDPGGTVLLTKTFNFTWEPVIAASQKWGPEYDQPTEKIYGTAPPGSEVSATSPYGSASMSVGGDGEYSLVIDFNDPPPNESFTISVTVAGEPFTFSFTYVVV
jgi:hypothetical protein